MMMIQVACTTRVRDIAKRMLRVESLHSTSRFDVLGDLEPYYDSDFWADHDEDCHGPIDTQENRRDHPEGFQWDCCDTSGAGSYHHDAFDHDYEDVDEDRLGEGCVLDRHVESKDGHKKRRY